MKIENVINYLYENGINAFIKECYFYLSDNYYENHFNVDTRGMVSKEDLGINHDELLEYLPISYRHVINILNKLPVEKNKSTLLEYGCGKGRVIVSAAAYQYKRIIGVELTNIINIAYDNIDKMRHRKTMNIVLKQCDAQDFDVPSDVNIIYFYNPFIGSVLENVIKNIYSSYKENPRKIYIIFFKNDSFDKVIAYQDWLTKIYQSKRHLNISFGLYETTSWQ